MRALVVHHSLLIRSSVTTSDFAYLIVKYYRKRKKGEARRPGTVGGKTALEDNIACYNLSTRYTFGDQIKTYTPGCLCPAGGAIRLTIQPSPTGTIQLLALRYFIYCVIHTRLPWVLMEQNGALSEYLAVMLNSIPTSIEC